MFWLILGIVGVIVAIIIYVVSDAWFDGGDIFAFSVIALIMAVALSIMGCLTSNSIATENAEINYDIVSDTKIVALKDNQNVSGNYYLFSGYVDEDLYYYYATETEFGYKTEKLKVNNVYIKYTKDEPHIEKHEPRFTNDVVTFFACCPCKPDRYIIYCPEGTITSEFNVDLE